MKLMSFSALYPVCLLVTGACLLTSVDAGPPATAPAAMSPEQVAALQKVIKPGGVDAQWMQVPWMTSTNIWAARKKAAEEGKPLFLWYMAGEPLGPC